MWTRAARAWGCPRWRSTKRSFASSTVQARRNRRHQWDGPASRDPTDCQAAYSCALNSWYANPRNPRIRFGPGTEVENVEPGADLAERPEGQRMRIRLPIG